MGGRLCKAALISWLRKRHPIMRFQETWLEAAFAPDVQIAAWSLPRGSGKSQFAGWLGACAMTPDSPLWSTGRETLITPASFEQSRVVHSFVKAALADSWHEYSSTDSGQRLPDRAQADRHAVAGTLQLRQASHGPFPIRADHCRRAGKLGDAWRRTDVGRASNVSRQIGGPTSRALSARGVRPHRARGGLNCATLDARQVGTSKRGRRQTMRSGIHGRPSPPSIR